MVLDNASVRFVPCTDGRPEGLGGIDLVAACTGVISRNYIGSYEVTNIDTVIDNASCAHVGNLITNVITEVGGIGGTAST